MTLRCPIFGLILVWMCISYMTTPIYLHLLFDYRITLRLLRYLDEVCMSEMPLLNFSRMVRPVGRGRGAHDPPPPLDYMAVMMQQFQQNQVFMQGVIDQLQNQNQNNNQNHQHGVDLQGFMRLSPPTFHHPEQPLEDDDWLRDVTRQFESAGVNSLNYVTFATYLLRGPAAQWWDTHKSSLAEGTVISWTEFMTTFRAHYIPQAIMSRMKAEFRNLVQGSKSVEAYEREFLHLSRYAGRDLPDDASRQEKFREGLNQELQLALALHIFPDFATMVNQTITLETARFRYKGA